jgi:hypothetical protein
MVSSIMQRKGNRSPEVPGTPSKGGRQPRKPLAGSVVTPRKSKRRQKTEDKFYPIRGILNEDDLRGYLIDWEDDPVTGEKFQPTWVHTCNRILYFLLLIMLLTETLHSTGTKKRRQYTCQIRLGAEDEDSEAQRRDILTIRK